ncbi:hypothetical protein PoB_001489700 [Plakobranchus ocellatus]|uniref:Uncharacterized protein n=1 Tax=Plakobranchus ocellatus TaxID=259542 RepID=A0AAV3Z1I3_9GAST|nr:hypothetical protein PoB_001489700 [Plakobranchus ocellatus]
MGLASFKCFYELWKMQAFRTSTPRPKGSCRSQGGLASQCHRRPDDDAYDDDDDDAYDDDDDDDDEDDDDDDDDDLLNIMSLAKTV